MIAHVVLFNPKVDLTVERMRTFTKSMRDCFRSVTHIKRAAVGRRAEVDPGYPRTFGDKTYQFAAILEFDDEAGLIAYLRHPRHEELGRLFWECCESTIVSEHQMIDALRDDLDRFAADLG